MIPSFGCLPEMRRVVMATHAIEHVHSRLNKTIKSREHFPCHDAARQLLPDCWAYGMDESEPTQAQSLVNFRSNVTRHFGLPRAELKK